MRKTVLSVVAAVILAGGVLMGCQSGPRVSDRQTPSLELARNNRVILTGESTAIMAQTANLLGRENDIKWNTTMGKLTVDRNGRIVYFTSDVPGTAVITAELTVDGQVLRDQTNVTVNAVH